MAGDSIDFGELANDLNLKQRVLDFMNDVDKASEMMETFFKRFKYEELSNEDKVRYDLFVAFALNSFFWMYLRIRGVEPTEHDIRGQIFRVKDYMNRSKKVYERNTIMPRIDQEAAKRFVRNALWTPNVENGTDSSSDDYD